MDGFWNKHNTFTSDLFQKNTPRRTAKFPSKKCSLNIAHNSFCFQSKWWQFFTRWQGGGRNNSTASIKYSSVDPSTFVDDVDVFEKRTIPPLLLEGEGLAPAGDSVTNGIRPFDPSIVWWTVTSFFSFSFLVLSCLLGDPITEKLLRLFFLQTHLGSSCWCFSNKKKFFFSFFPLFLANKIPTSEIFFQPPQKNDRSIALFFKIIMPSKSFGCSSCY